MADISNIRTLEDIINILNILFFNLDKMNNVYYDMYLNPAPTNITLEKMDDNGNITTTSIPNVASLRRIAYTGTTNPNGKQTAPVGSLYINTTNAELFFKSVGSDSSGWIKVWGSNDQIPVSGGGTGANNLSGILKGNGSSRITAAEDGKDYIGPSIVGSIIYWAGNTSNIPSGWLNCNGDSYSQSEFAALYGVIGNTFNGSAAIGGGQFRVPNISTGISNVIAIIKY